jgi:hypothetical protein
MDFAQGSPQQELASFISPPSKFIFLSLHRACPLRAFQPLDSPNPCMRQRSINLLLATMRASIPKTTTMSGASASSSHAAAARSSASVAASAGAFLRKPLLSIGGRPRPYTTTTSRISMASPLSVRASADSRRSLAAEAAAVSCFVSFRFVSFFFFLVKASFQCFAARLLLREPSGMPFPGPLVRRVAAH